MPRPQGTPLTHTVLKMYVPESHVLTLKKKRYVFMQLVNKHVYAIMESSEDPKALKGRYFACIKRNGYALKEIYGLAAIDIDEPMLEGSPVSVELKFTVGEGKDEEFRKK